MSWEDQKTRALSVEKAIYFNKTLEKLKIKFQGNGIFRKCTTYLESTGCGAAITGIAANP